MQGTWPQPVCNCPGSGQDLPLRHIDEVAKAASSIVEDAH